MGIDRAERDTLIKRVQGPFFSNGNGNGKSLTEVSESKHQKPCSWRTTVAGGAATAAAVCLINVVVLVWGVASRGSVEQSGQSTGIVTLYTGSCDTTKRTILLVDLTVNVLSTILLAASNNCAQLLASPTRSEIDAAHADGKWMDIGVPSVRNVFRIARWRAVLWMLLFLTSIPLHLVYNSVIFKSFATYDYEAALVTHDFLDGAWWNDTGVRNGFDYMSAAQAKRMRYMQDHLQNLHPLENAKCIKAYGTSPLLTDWRNVLIVSNLTAKDNLIQVWSSDFSSKRTDWICSDSIYARDEMFVPFCDVSSVLRSASNWTISNVRKSSNTSPDKNHLSRPVAAKVDYCLAEPGTPHCTVQLNAYLLLVVISCNAIKFACLAFTASRRNFKPLANIGDGLASFLDCPEARTANTGPLSVVDVRAQLRFWNPKAHCVALKNARWTGNRRRSARAVSLIRWGCCILPCLALVGTASGYFNAASEVAYGLYSQREVSLSGLWALGVGTYYPSLEVYRFDSSWSLVANVLQANTPQLLVSIVYLLYNNIFTSMVTAYEWSRLAQSRRGLRVSRPEPGSAQRSTLWLGIPYRFIVPIIALTAVLHWLIGQSFFFVQLDEFNLSGERRPYRNLACAYSPIAIFLAIVVGCVLIVALLAFSLVPLGSGIPVVGSCSLAISAAAHAPVGDDDIARHELMYGIIERPMIDGVVRERVGFSSREVAPLVKGGLYI